LKQFVTTGSDQLHWGIGSHACPGRFFAAYEIKMLLTDILTKYDMRLADKGGVRPPDIAKDIRVIPNPAAKVSFKRR
jgi:cytochrome P450